MLKFIGMIKEKEKCLPNKEYISGIDEKYTCGCQKHGTNAYYCWAKSLLVVVFNIIVYLLTQIR